MSQTIGIDLGNSSCSAAVMVKGKVEIISSEVGLNTIPSFVAFTAAENLVGDGALAQAPKNLNNTVYDVKRLMGHKFSDPQVQADAKNWAFKIEAGEDDKPLFNVQYMGEEKKFSPEEISAMMLTKMKHLSEEFLGKPVENVVITCPANYNDAQRQAVKNAAEIACLNVKRIINEPTAAALAYGFDKKEAGQRTSLVFDLGGGKFDVSVISVDDGLINVLSTKGNSHLGGEDFTTKMVEFCSEWFDKKSGISLKGNKRALRKLRTQCDQAKKTLSASVKTTIEVECIAEGEDFTMQITRAKFEEICGDMMRSTIESVEGALFDANMDKDHIDDLVMVGGSSRIPFIQETLANFFKGKELKKTILADEIVAYGAAVQAAIEDQNEKVEDMSVVDICPLSLGLETAGGVMTMVVPRGHRVPTKRTITFTTHEDNQAGVRLSVFEGERPLVADNHAIAKFNLNGLTAAPKGTAKIDVTFEIDHNGILGVTASEEISGKSEKITVTNNKERLTQKQVDHFVQEARGNKQHDHDALAKVEGTK